MVPLMVWGRTNFQNACVNAAIFCPMLTLLPPPSPDIPEADAADAWAATCGDRACVLCWWLKCEGLEGKGADADGDVTLDGDMTLVGCASFGTKGRHCDCVCIHSNIDLSLCAFQGGT